MEVIIGTSNWLNKYQIAAKTYVQADKVEVKDGVLVFVQNQEEGEKIIMAFAPGTWLSVHITPGKNNKVGS